MPGKKRALSPVIAGTSLEENGEVRLEPSDDEVDEQCRKQSRKKRKNAKGKGSTASEVLEVLSYICHGLRNLRFMFTADPEIAPTRTLAL